MSPSTISSLRSLLDRYRAETHAFRPDEARDLGLHEYDGLLPEIGADARRHRLLFLQELLKALGKNPLGLDARLFHHALRSEVWRLRVERRDETDPLHALTQLDPSGYLRWDYAPWEERGERLVEHLRRIPGFLETVRGELEPRLPLPVLSTAIEAWKGMHAFLDRQLPQAVRAVHPSPPAGFSVAAAAAVAEVGRHWRFLQEECLPRARADFALGRPAFEGMLREGEGLPLEIEEVVAAGEKDLRRNRRSFEELCAQIAPKLPPRRVLETLAASAPAESDLLAKTRKTLELLRQFVRDHGLVSIPSSVDLQIETTPPWMRWAVAMLEVPGPFAPAGLSARYFLTPEEADWMPSRKQQWRIFLHPSYLQVITSHETIPGHYLHALHLRNTQNPTARLFSTTYHFWEGWAHYAEELLVEEGFGGPLFHLMQVKAALERDARLLCSVGLHVEGWDLSEATAFFVDRALVDEHTARREVERGTFDPQYLGYTLGKLLIRRLREDLREIQGGGFRKRDFHDRVLSAGAPPVSLLREEVFGLRGRPLL